MTIAIRSSLAMGIVAAVVGLGTAATTWADGPYRGKVIDAETKQPIEGAVVVGVWRRQPALALHPTYVFEEAKEVLTDKEGEFTLSGHVSIKSILSPLSDVWVDIYIYKAGYGSFPRFQTFPKVKQSHDAKLKPFETHGLVELPKLKTREERIDVVGMACPRTDIPDAKLSNLIPDMNSERIALGLEPTACFLGEFK